MEIPYSIGQHIWGVDARDNKIQINEYEITMITIKKDLTIKLRLTRVKEKWSHEICATALNRVDEKTCNCYHTYEECAKKHYELLKALEGHN